MILYVFFAGVDPCCRVLAAPRPVVHAQWCTPGGPTVAGEQAGRAGRGRRQGTQRPGRGSATDRQRALHPLHQTVIKLSESRFWSDATPAHASFIHRRLFPSFIVSSERHSFITIHFRTSKSELTSPIPCNALLVGLPFTSS